MAETAQLPPPTGTSPDSSKDSPFYTKAAPRISATTRHLLETYSHIPADRVEAHVLWARDKAWAIHPYPCIGQFRFLDLAIAQTPFYDELLRRLRAPAAGPDAPRQTLLDIGCCLGQDVRRLVADGAPGSCIVASDVRAEFWELGYEVFRDRDTLGVRFVPGDVFDDGEGTPLRALEGRVDMVHASSFVHLFDYEDQLRCCERLVRLLRPVPGSVVFGRQMGRVEPGRYERHSSSTRGGYRYQHDPTTFERFWMEVGERVGVKLKADCAWSPVPEEERTEDMKLWAKRGARRLRFAVWRL